MATFAFIHGGGDSGWSWHLVEEELRSRGHSTVAPDLPIEDDSAGLEEYTNTVVQAIGDATDVVVVAHSIGGFIAPLVAERVSARAIVLVTAVMLAPGETGEEWFVNTGWQEASQKQAEEDGGLTGNEDPFVLWFNGVTRPLAEEAMRRERRNADTAGKQPNPLAAWPDIPTHFVLCTEDHLSSTLGS